MFSIKLPNKRTLAPELNQLNRTCAVHFSWIAFHDHLRLLLEEEIAIFQRKTNEQKGSTQHRKNSVRVCVYVNVCCENIKRAVTRDIRYTAIRNKLIQHFSPAAPCWGILLTLVLCPVVTLGDHKETSQQSRRRPVRSPRILVRFGVFCTGFPQFCQFVTGNNLSIRDFCRTCTLARHSHTVTYTTRPDGKVLWDGCMWAAGFWLFIYAVIHSLNTGQPLSGQPKSGGNRDNPSNDNTATGASLLCSSGGNFIYDLSRFTCLWLLSAGQERSHSARMSSVLTLHPIWFVSFKLIS